MLRSSHAVLAVLALAAPALAQAPATGLYGVANFGNPFQTQSLYRVDTATGAATLVGSTGLAQISGIAFDGANLWAYTAAADLYHLNPATGASTLIASLADQSPEGDIAVFGPAAFIARGSQIAAVNLATAALTPTFDLAAAGASDISGLLFSPAGSLALALNGSAPDTLLALSPAGSVVAAFPTGTNSLSVGALASDGANLWISDGSALTRFDALAGVATPVGAFGVSGMSGLTWIPTPGAAALLALGGLVAARRRRA